jgi:pSer/pThr/pTyr-binding forkhead associated (FHA) protein
VVTCPYCQAKYPENTLFCDECGSSLQINNHKETALVSVGGATSEQTSEADKEKVTSPLALKLIMLDSGRHVEVPLTTEVDIGRLDSASAWFPQVDLTRDGGLEQGVSRCHAKITRRGREVFIEDLGSINGTFLNRKKLSPYLSRVLKNGDELQLGTLKMQVSFIK